MIAEKIDLYPVESSNLSALGYDERKQIAAVRFKSGEIFHYAGIDRVMMQDWLDALSKGQFYSLHVRGKFQGQKMTGHCPKCGAMGWVGEGCDDCGCATYAEDVRKPKEGVANGQR